jgi:hypothetical protein
MTIDFTQDTFYKYERFGGGIDLQEEYYDSGEGWDEFKIILNDTLAFDILPKENQIELLELSSKFSSCSVRYNQSYFDSKSNYQK